MPNILQNVHTWILPGCTEFVLLPRSRNKLNDTAIGCVHDCKSPNLLINKIGTGIGPFCAVASCSPYWVMLHLQLLDYVKRHDLIF